MYNIPTPTLLWLKCKSGHTSRNYQKKTVTQLEKDCNVPEVLYIIGLVKMITPTHIFYISYSFG